jgi:predicted TIM-barrel fold metal-dependent hydrolase
MSVHPNRREFLRQVSAWTATGGAAAGGLSLLGSNLHSALAQEKKDASVNDDKAIPVVDTHLHLWDLTKFRLPWTKNAGLEALDRSYVMSDFLEATKGLNVTKAVYMEVDVDPAQQPQEADYVIDICRRGETPMVAAVISGRPNSPEFKDYITKYADSPYIKGVRQVLHGDSTPAGYCLQPQFVKSVQLLGELGKSFDLCMRAGEILDGVKLVDQCPKTRFIVDHCGNMDVQSKDAALRAKWMKGMQEMAQRPNVVCKISGIVVTAPKNWTPDDLAPNMNFTMETFGHDRIMFAGDWPVCTLRAAYRRWLGALQTIVNNWSSEDKRKLFHDNAVRFYGLTKAGT